DHGAGRVLPRNGARDEPPVDAVVPAMAHLHLVPGSLTERAFPLGHASLVIVGMDHELRLAPPLFLRREPCVFDPLLVDVGERAVAGGGLYDRADGPGQVPESLGTPP